MTSPITLSVQGEELWRNLRYHVEWAEGFTLIFIFSSNKLLQHIVCERLSRLYQTRVSYLQCISPASAATVADEVMALLRQREALHEHAAAPLWLDLSTNHDTAWSQARDSLLLRLNEHRDLLRQRQRRPVLVILPADYRPQVRDLAPDLWAIRSFSLDLDDPALRQPVDAGQVVTHLDVPQDPVRPPGVTWGAFEEAQWQEWGRLQKSGATGQELLRAGWRAIDATLSARQLLRAEQIATEVLAIARRQLERLWATPETVRDLSISLERVGDVAEVQGQRDEAIALYQEALRLWQRLDQAFPGTPDYQDGLKRVTRRLATLPVLSAQDTHS